MSWKKPKTDHEIYNEYIDNIIDRHIEAKKNLSSPDFVKFGWDDLREYEKPRVITLFIAAKYRNEIGDGISESDGYHDIMDGILSFLQEEDMESLQKVGNLLKFNILNHFEREAKKSFEDSVEVREDGWIDEKGFRLQQDSHSGEYYYE